MKDLNALFSGAGALANTSDNVKITMPNGLATLIDVTEHLSKKKNDCALIRFRGNAKPDDETFGHDEYVSMSEGARFERVFKKIVYIAKHSKNEQARQLFAQLPNPMEYINGTFNDAGELIESDTPIEFTTNEQLETIRAMHGEDVKFIWADDDHNTRIALRFINAKEYIAQLITVLKGFIGEVFYLETKIDKNRGFQKLLSINQPKL